MKKALMILLSLLLVLVVLVKLSSKPQERQGLFEYQIKEDKTKPKETQVHDWLDGFLKQDKKLIPVHKIYDVEYLNKNYYQAWFDVTYAPRRSSEEIFVEGTNNLVFELQVMVGEWSLLNVYTQEEYDVMNNNSEVDFEDTIPERIQMRESERMLEYTVDSGKTWNKTLIPYADIDQRYDDASLKNTSALYGDKRNTYLITKEEGKAVLNHTKDKGKSWDRTSIYVEGVEAEYYGNPSILYAEGNEIIATFAINQAMGSTQSIVARSTNNGLNFKYISEVSGSKMIIKSNVIKDQIYIENTVGEVYVSDDQGFTLVPLKLPDFNEVLDSGIEFTDVYTYLELPYESDGRIYMHLNQGPNGDSNINSKALFVFDENTQKYEFVRYILYKDPIID